MTGTWNRLRHLQAFVESARRSILVPLTYEIILVDGGSTDGTIAWAKGQPDVRLIEQGELLGAVTAFNAGFVAASGGYVIAGNDDIEFIGRSITRAWCFLEDNPQCGQGCFYQKRGRNQAWHIEVMQARVDGQSRSVPYGQVAIVPKWLGERVGWWGKITHTYAGDNELSANLWANGYTVEGVSGAGIVDRMAMDGLREKNQGDPREMAQRGETHPDSAVFYRKWPQGPVVTHMPKWGYRELGQRRILYAPIIETDYPEAKEQKTGLREALRGLGRVIEYDYQAKARALGVDRMRHELLDLATDWQPHLALLQVHSPEEIDARTVGELRRAVPKAQMVNWNGDYRRDHIDGPGGLELARAFDCQCVANASEFKRYVERGANAAYWQIGFEAAGVGHEPNGDTPRHEVVLLGNCYTDGRKALGSFLKGLGVGFGIYGSGWPQGWTSGETLYDFREGCKLLRAAKVAIGDQQWPDEEGYVSNRLFQTLAAGGAVLCQQRFAGMTEWLGLEEGKHLLCWESQEDLADKVHWALSHERKRRAIALEGQRFMLEHHSFEARIRELDEVILDGRWG